MTPRQVIDQVLRGLEPSRTRALAGVAIDVRFRPTPEDLQRGVRPMAQGCFYGEPSSWKADQVTSSRLPEERPATGEIVLFIDNLQPATAARLSVALEHELAHALGYSEDEIVWQLGLTLAPRDGAARSG